MKIIKRKQNIIIASFILLAILTISSVYYFSNYHYGFDKDISKDSSNLVRVDIKPDSKKKLKGLTEVRGMASDGNCVVFTYEKHKLNGDIYSKIYFRDIKNNKTTLICLRPDDSVGMCLSSNAVISKDGRYIVFLADDNDIISGDDNGAKMDNNGYLDVILYDTVDDTHKSISANETGVQANGYASSPVISDDGTKIYYISTSTNLINSKNSAPGIFMYNVLTDETTRLDISQDKIVGKKKKDNEEPSGTWQDTLGSIQDVSNDGRYLALNLMPKDIKNKMSKSSERSYRYDTLKNNLEKTHPKDDENFDNWYEVASSSISGDGRYIVYNNLLDELYLYDFETEKRIRIHDENIKEYDTGAFSNADISSDSRYLSYEYVQDYKKQYYLYRYDIKKEKYKIIKTFSNAESSYIDMDDSYHYLMGSISQVSKDGEYIAFTNVVSERQSNCYRIKIE